MEKKPGEKLGVFIFFATIVICSAIITYISMAP